MQARMVQTTNHQFHLKLDIDTNSDIRAHSLVYGLSIAVLAGNGEHPQEEEDHKLGDVGKHMGRGADGHAG